ncbi:MAG TPA: flagellar assembly protein FliW [Acidimicrobiales bacterium]|nr:flagellar assembly protein FliW [Acidimicrobiales bacterium]
MRVTTERFGDLDVAADRVLSFPDGLPGFADAHGFVLVDVQDNEAFFWLQSTEDPGLAFLCAIPWLFFPEYAPEVPDDDQTALELETAEDAMVLTILTVHREESYVTANLLGPVVVNQRTRVGRQVVLFGDDYPVQAPLVA